MDLRSMLAPLVRRVENMASRAIVSLVNDSAKIQALQLDVLTGETRGGVERFQEYGFTSVPLEGAEAVVLFVGGRRDHGLVVAVDDRRNRLAGLQPGEVAVYTDEGDSVVIKRGGTVEVTAATKVVVASPLVELAGASDAAYRGTAHRSADASLSSALATFAAALGTYAAAIKTITDPPGTATGALASAITAFNAAVTAYEAAAQAALSTKVKLS